MRWQDSIWVVPPPQNQTVKKTMSSVVENIIRRAYVAVSLIDRAKVIAPRSPDEQREKRAVFESTERGCRHRTRTSTLWMLLTCKHHHVLEVGSDLVASSQIEKEGERVDVCSSSQEHCQLGGSVVKEALTNRVREASALSARSTGPLNRFARGLRGSETRH